MHARLCGPNNLFFLHQLINRTCFHCLADEIAEQRPDMNIKVAAFTVSEKVYKYAICRVSTLILSAKIVICHKDQGPESQYLLRVKEDLS